MRIPLSRNRLAAIALVAVVATSVGAMGLAFSTHAGSPGPVADTGGVASGASTPNADAVTTTASAPTGGQSSGDDEGEHEEHEEHDD